MNKFTLDFFRTKSKTAIKGLFVLFAFLLMNTQTSWGQVAVSYTAFTTVTCPSTPSATISAAPSGLSFSQMSRGSGVACATAGGSINGSGFNGTLAANITANKWYTFTITSDASKAFTLNSLSIVSRVSSATGSPNVSVQYSIGGAAPTTVIGSYTPTTTATAYTITPGSAISVGASQVLRIYIIPNTLTASGTTCRVENNTSATVTTSAAGSTPPTLSADATLNTVDNPIDITFTDDSAWRAAVMAVKIGSTALTASTDYDLTAGNLKLKPSGLNALLTTSGSKSITITATGYTEATVTQVINAGAPTSTNSTATISAALAPNTTRTITCTAKDQYNNLVSGYTFGYDVTVTNNTGTTTESYTIDSSAFTATSTGNPVTATTNASGVATFTAALPATIDPSDGISVQVQLADDTTNVGTAFSFAQLAAQTITFDALTPVTYGDATFGLTATASSTLPVSYTSSNTAVATVSGSIVTIVGAGSTNITASQAGDGSYNAAEDVIQSLTVNAKALTLSDAAATSRAYNTLFTTNITGTLTGVINSDDVSLVGTLKGTFADANVADGIAVTAACTLSGTKAGNYALTQPTGLTANITQASQTITFGALANKILGAANFTLSATASSGLAVTYVSSNEAVATVSGNTIIIVGIGSTNITASQTGDTNYVAAPDVLQPLTVIAVPIAAWDFTGVGSTTIATLAATTLNTSLAATSITRGANAGWSTGGNSWRTTGFQNNGISTANTDFFQITIQANAGKTVSLSTIDANLAGTSSFAVSPGVSSQFAYSLDGTNFTLIGSAAVTIGTPASLPQIDLSGISALQNVASGTTITLRYYASGQTTTGGWGFNSASAGTNGLAIGGVTTLVSTTWNGTSWSNGAPTASVDAIIAGDYSVAANITAKTLTVNNSAVATIPSGNNVTVTGAVTVTAPATLTLSNNANLIQGGTTNTNTGNVIVKRNSSPLKRLDYTLWSSPVSGTLTLEQFSPKTSRDPNRFYTYNGGSAFAAIATTSTFEAGKGYLIRMPNDASTSPTAFEGVFTGTLNNGTITVSGLDSDKYYSVGNPYPSTISADAFLTANPGTLYFWRKTNGAGGGAYATYNGTGAASGAGSDTPDGTIQVGQGFIAKTGAAASSLVFTNAMRLGTTTNQFFKTKNTVEKSRVWLDLTATTGGLFSQALVGYLDGATLGVDNGYDGKYLNDSPTDAALTSIVDGGEYTIQGRPAFDVTDVVALGFKTGTAGDFTIAINKKDGALASQDIYLVDSKTGIETDLNAGSYTFNAAVGTDNTRFSLKYQKTLKVDAPTFDDNSVKVYQNKGAIYVNSTSKTIKTIQVYDVQGRLIAQQKNVNAATATIHNLKAVSQMLIVKVSAVDNSVVSKKVMN